MNYMLAIDPGKTVGHAWFKYNDGEINDIQADELEWDVFLETFEFIAKNVNKNEFKVLIEDYTIKSTTIAANLNKELLTAKVIGVIEWTCKKNNIECVFQPAGIGKAFFDKQRLKEMDLWVVGKKHARDATRHGLWHLTFGRD